MLAIERLCGAVGGDIFHFAVPPDITSLFDMDVNIGTTEDNDAADGIALLEGVIDILLERDALSTAVATIGSHDDFGPAVSNTILDAVRAESTKDDGVNGPDAGARQHGDGSLGNERHVDKDTIPLLDSVALEDIGEFADFAVKLAIGQDALLPRLPLPDNRRLIGPGCLKMTVEAVVRGIDLPANEPLGIRNFPIEHLAPFLEPVKFVSLTSPEFVGLVEGFGMKLPVLGHAANAGFFGKRRRGLENPVFDKMGLDVGFGILGHGRNI